MKKISPKKIHIIILILGSIFIFLSILHKSLWFDETYSIAIANHTFYDIWKIGGNDVHPVLYYWMLRIVCLFTGGTILPYRIFSTVPIILLGVVGFTHIREDFGEKIGLFFTFITFFLPVSAVYANQIRMYSWAILILSLFFIYSYRLTKQKIETKDWILFFIFSLCSIYIHYYGLIAVGITYLILLISFIINKNIKKIKNIIVCIIAQIALYIPWIIYFIGQLEHVSEGFWITFKLKDKMALIGAQFIIGENVYIGAIIGILLYLYIFISIIKKKYRIDIKLVISALLIYALVIVTAIIVQKILKTPILYHRYLFVITGLYIFVLSYILAHENNKYIVSMICMVITLLGLLNNIYQMKENYCLNNLAPINYLNQNLELEDEIIYRNIGIGSMIALNFNNKQYFYNPEDWKVKEAYRAYEPQMKTYTTKDFIKDLPDKFWVIDTWDEGLYNEFFNNEKYKVIKNEKFKINYYEQYEYDIKLIEKVED